jgi:hypothetical protein
VLLLLLLYFFLSPFLSASPLHTLAHIHPANLDHRSPRGHRTPVCPSLRRDVPPGSAA